MVGTQFSFTPKESTSSRIILIPMGGEIDFQGLVSRLEPILEQYPVTIKHTQEEVRIELKDTESSPKPQMEPRYYYVLGPGSTPDDFRKNLALTKLSPGKKPGSLLFLHADRSIPPKNTRAYLDCGDFRGHFHIAPSHGPDIHRLARILTGNAIGLVLSGGGGRGFAQLGVIKALNDLGVPVDFVGGSSMGALMAAMCAIEHPIPQKAAEIGKYLKPNNSFVDRTFPFLSLIRGTKGKKSLAHLCEGWNLENLWITCYCVATDLVESDTVCLKTGPLWKAVQASVAFPGLFPPVIWGNQYLVDGGLLNPLPAECMVEYSPGAIIAVDTETENEFHCPTEEEIDHSGWRLLWRKLNPFYKKKLPPHVLQVFRRIIEAPGLQKKRAILRHFPIDLYLRIDEGDFKIDDFQQFEHLRKTGYRLTLAHSELLKELVHKGKKNLTLLQSTQKTIKN